MLEKFKLKAHKKNVNNWLFTQKQIGVPEWLEPTIFGTRNIDKLKYKKLSRKEKKSITHSIGRTKKTRIKWFSF